MHKFVSFGAHMHGGITAAAEIAIRCLFSIFELRERNDGDSLGDPFGDGY